MNVPNTILMTQSNIFFIGNYTNLNGSKVLYLEKAHTKLLN